MKNFVIGNLWWIAFLLTFILLAAHAFAIEQVTVDTTTIMLLVVLLLSPLSSAITKIKFGDFEAEIKPREVRRIKEEVQAELAEREDSAENGSQKIAALTGRILVLAEEDPALALAKVRMEVERIASKIHQALGLNKSSKRPLPLRAMIVDLGRAEVFSKDIGTSLLEVISICNRAIHGAELRPQEAKTIIEVGSSLLEILHEELRSIVTDSDTEYIVIDSSTVEDYLHAHYRLTTVTPYVENPVQSVRILSQGDLDDFFEGYDEFAEFVVDLRRITSADANPKGEH